MANNLKTVRIPGLRRVPNNIKINAGWFVPIWNPGDDETYRAEILELPFVARGELFRVVAWPLFAADVRNGRLLPGRTTRITGRRGTRPLSDVVVQEVAPKQIGMAVEVFPDVAVGPLLTPGEVRLVKYTPDNDVIAEAVGPYLMPADAFRYVSRADFYNDWQEERMKGGRFSIIQERTGTRPASRVAVLELGQQQYAFALELAPDVSDGAGGTIAGGITAVTYNAGDDSIAPMPVGGLTADMLAAIQGGAAPSAANPFVTQTTMAAKADLVGGKVPASQLPSYVDDVLESPSVAALPAIGEPGKIYIITGGPDENKQYRWTGSMYALTGGGGGPVAGGPQTAIATRANLPIVFDKDYHMDRQADVPITIDTTGGIAGATVRLPYFFTGAIPALPAACEVTSGAFAANRESVLYFHFVTAAEIEVTIRQKT